MTMNLRNGKNTIEKKLPHIKDVVFESTIVEKDPTKKFTDHLQCLFTEIAIHESGSYMRLSISCDLFEFVDDHIDKFKDIPRLSKLFTSIRETSLRLMAQLGHVAMKNGKDPEIAKVLNRLSCALFNVLAKLGSA